MFEFLLFDYIKAYFSLNMKDIFDKCFDLYLLYNLLIHNAKGSLVFTLFVKN